MKRFILILPILLIACVAPKTPAQAVFEAESTYGVALRTELAYSNLPRCSAPTSPNICSEVSVIKKLQKADNVAWSAIKEAQKAVRTPGYGESKVVTAVASATALTNAFVEITNTLKIQ